VLKHMTSAEAATRRPQRDMTADDEDWRLAAAARFSPEQQAAICALRVPHFVNIGRLRARRAGLSAQLQVRCRPRHCRRPCGRRQWRSCGARLLMRLAHSRSSQHG
jgi:hypothetical protein